MKLIILDRDGVINEDSDDYIKSADEWQPIEGSLEAIARLNQAGFSVVVASNQSGIARGYFDLATLAEMHRKMDGLLAGHGARIEAVFFCPHAPRDDCDCRKPKPGLLNDIASRYAVNLAEVYVVGDSLRDIEAAAAVNARPLLVRTGKGEATVEKLSSSGFSRIPVFDNLAAAADAVITWEANVHE